MKKSEISIIGGLLLALAVTFATDSNLQAYSIRQNTLRLHIIARDDSALSRNIKMQVKEAVTRIAPSIYFDAENFEQAVDCTQENLDFIQQVTDNTLKKLDAVYTSKCSIEQFYFDTTQYDGFTMPRGRYTALTIRLGDAQGANWWCVLYPGLCAGSGAEYEDDSSNTFIETDRFRLKFKAVELWEDIKYLFDTKTEKYSHMGA